MFTTSEGLFVPTNFIALAVVAGASFSTAQAKDKKPKKPAKTTVSVTTAADTLSYAAGMAMSRGVDQYLKQSFGIDKENYGDVVRGFREAVGKRGDKAFAAYCAGMELLRMMEKNMLPGLKKELGEGANTINENLLFEGFTASLLGDTTVCTQQSAEKLFNGTREEAKRKAGEAVRLEGEQFLAQNKQKEGVVTLPDGLQYKVLKEGNGPRPEATDEVEVIYEGRTIDGNVFDATYKHQGKESDKFRVNGLIKGWTEALKLMPVGSKWEIYITYSAGYGAQQVSQDLKPFSTLIFTVELLGIEKKPEPQAAPNAAAPKVK